MNYSNSLTQSYKSGYVHSATVNGTEVVTAQFKDKSFNATSIQGAKCWITRQTMVLIKQ